MPRKASKRGLTELPQTDVTWHVAIHPLRVWVMEEETPMRPWAVVTFNLTSELILHSGVMPEKPDPGAVAEFLAEAMRRRDTSLGMKPHRPALVQLEDQSLVDMLGPQLAKIGVRASYAERPPGVQALLAGLEEHLRGGPEPSGLLGVRGVKPPHVAALFTAAAEFYRAAPWNILRDRHVFAVETPDLKGSRFVIVLGAGGMEYGLAVYEKWEEIERTYAPLENQLDWVPAKGAHALYFNEISAVPFSDLDAITEYGWEIAAEDAYPVPLILTRNGEARRPQRTELQWYEAVLRALPIFVRDYLQPGDQEGFATVEATIPVAITAGDVQVHIRYPGGVLPDPEDQFIPGLDWLDEDDEDDLEDVMNFDELGAPDRRAMEGMMGNILGGILGGGRPRSAVDDAQETMYEAWDERNPKRRIALARKALQQSPDCADAYVLLAEEEARSLGAALKYYEEGVAAGERALGKRAFKEDVGHFWGLLETRPYMRARQGLANTLWQMGRKEEAQAHFRELLRLNPNDNQGVRYSLLNLLLEMNEDDKARALIKQYDEDGMAEWMYTKALLAFRKGGAGRQANAALAAALEGNPYVPKYLTGKKRIPAHLPDYMGFGDESEAAHYASGYLHHWRRTPGVIDWLKQAGR
jgi:tetratricopeptide (TPR) repeat protein